MRNNKKMKFDILCNLYYNYYNATYVVNTDSRFIGNRKRIFMRKIITLEKAEHVASLLWPNTKIKSAFIRELWYYMQGQYEQQQCVVLYMVSRKFREFLANNPMSDIGRKEVIINKEGTVIFHEDYRYPGSGKIYSYN